MNAFTIHWSNYHTVYAFPPSNLVGKVLHKWSKETRGKMILIALDLSTQNYYSQLKRVAHRKVLLKLQERDLLLPTHKGFIPVQQDKFHLTAFLI